jgi:hypothetical protein
MAEPVFIGGRSFGGAAFGGETPRPPRAGRWTRVRRAVRGWSRAALGWATRPARLLPGVAAMGSAIAGSFLLWGAGVALLVAAGFLLLLDARTPRG